MANSVLPEDLMLCILSRLPVKTITRFKSVCKPWYDLFSTPEFKKLHQCQFSSDPENQSFILHSFNNDCMPPINQFSIFNIEYGTKKPTILDHSFADAQNIKLDTVGCCNGLVCIRRGQEIVLWNPAMKFSKTVPLKDYGHLKKMSLGFGYDATRDDFKVLIFLAGGKGVILKLACVEIYSANLDSWSIVDVGFQFGGFKDKNDLIVNGNPYWDASVEGNKVLLCFDVSELVFKIVPLPTIYMMGLDEEADVDLDGLVEETETETETEIDFVDWNGALGAIVINYEIEYRVGACRILSSTVEYVWVFDDIERIWRNNHTFVPIEVDVEVTRPLHCTKTEKIMCEFSVNKMLVLDLETCCGKELFDGAHLRNSFEVFAYTESLAHINGMEKVTVKNEQNDLDVCWEVGVC
ncbi:hypothetical protein CASFOL_013201 [Castilleja foliolosa]|uniref:F-box domain-containing protein n=1 Tax=Castilleja foliolosa TaxID=1961234 RepID=A0ABD3DNE8_9LAMI